MVSTEENSSGLKAALRGLMPGILPGLRDVTSSDETPYVRTHGEALAPGASEPAHAFSYDLASFLAQQGTVNAPDSQPAGSAPTLVGDNNTPAHGQAVSTSSKAHGLEALITEKDIKKIAAEVMQRCMAAGVSPSEIDKLIATLKSNVGASKSSLEDIRGAALKDADDLVNDAKGKASETPEAKIERLWGEINAGIKDTIKEVDDLAAAGIIDKDKQKELDKELKAIEAMADGPEKEKRLKLFYKKYDLYLEELKEQYPQGSPEREKIDSVLQGNKKQKEELDELTTMERDITTRGHGSQLSSEIAQIDNAPKVVSAASTTEPSSHSMLSGQKTSNTAVSFEGDHSNAALGQLPKQVANQTAQTAPQKGSLLLG